MGPALNNALKKALKKSSLKAIKTKAAKESFKGLIEEY
jgi:hypothetical protein